MTDAEVPLGSVRDPVMRRGDVVLRPFKPWTRSVHALLRHLEAAGFGGAPRVVGSGVSDDGREVVTFIEGERAVSWPDEGLFELGAMLRALHGAAALFVAPPDAQWQDWWNRSQEPGAVCSHGDTGPWNVVQRDGHPVAFIDWEFAGPLDPLDAVAELTWLNAQFHDDDVAERQGLPPAAERIRRAAFVLEGYELARAERAGFVTRMIECAVRQCAYDAMVLGITRESTEAQPGLWTLAWQIRSAAWMIRHRPALQRVLEDIAGL